jgi:hypothetical protein
MRFAEEKQVLGLIWNVMRTFLKFGDDDNKMSAQDSLKMWCQNQVGHSGIDTTSAEMRSSSDNWLQRRRHPELPVELARWSRVLRDHSQVPTARESALFAIAPSAGSHPIRVRS